MFLSILLSACLHFWYPVTIEKPIVKWLTEQDHDFGAIPPEQPVQFTFSFKNISSDSILLQTARTTCGCTTPRWTETPVAPNATGTLIVEYDALQMGSFEKKIRVFFDKQRKPEILWIRGDVEK